MGNVSRKKLLVKNSIVVVITTLFSMVLNFVRYRLYLQSFGNDINGVIQTGNQILSYLSLIESGLSASYLYSLYKPKAVCDYDEVSSLYKGFRKTMYNVVAKMFLVAILICFIYPFFINAASVNYNQCVVIFVLLSIKYILPYIVSIVPKNMIILTEKKYYVEIIAGVIIIVDYLYEIIMMMCTNYSIVVILSTSVILYIGLNCLYYLCMRLQYKGLLDHKAKPNYSPKKMQGALLIHNISTLAFNSTDTIILSVFGDMKMVSIYAAYNSLSTSIFSLVKKLVEGVDAILGIKLAKKDSNAESVFNTLFSIVNYIGIVVAGGFYLFASPVVAIWIGENYIMSEIAVIVLALIIYSNIILTIIYSARNGKGLYEESKTFTLVQAVVNIVFSLILVGYMGILGVLLATCLARFFITIPCNAKLVVKRVFAKSCFSIVPVLIFDSIILVLTVAVKFIVRSFLNFSWFINMIIEGGVFISLSLIIFLIVFKNTRIELVSIIKKIRTK